MPSMGLRESVRLVLTHDQLCRLGDECSRIVKGYREKFHIPAAGLSGHMVLWPEDTGYHYQTGPLIEALKAAGLKTKAEWDEAVDALERDIRAAQEKVVDEVTPGDLTKLSDEVAKLMEKSKLAERAVRLTLGIDFVERRMRERQHKKTCPRCGQVGLEYAQEQPTEVFVDINGGEHKAVTSYVCPSCGSHIDLDHVRGMWR